MYNQKKERRSLNRRLNEHRFKVKNIHTDEFWVEMLTVDQKNRVYAPLWGDDAYEPLPYKVY